VTGAAFVLAIIIGLMLAETRVSYAHERRLRDRGAVMPDGDVYRALAILYPLAFLLMGLEGIWRASDTPVATLQGPSWFASGLLMFVASKALKYWAIASLGERWTFRVLVLPGAPLVTTGPYRYVAHPNYIAVVGELVGTAMMMGARVTGPVMTALFGIALFARVRFENRVLGV
jgi:methyltransferase